MSQLLDLFVGVQGAIDDLLDAVLLLLDMEEFIPGADLSSVTFLKAK